MQTSVHIFLFCALTGWLTTHRVQWQSIYARALNSSSSTTTTSISSCGRSLSLHIWWHLNAFSRRRRRKPADRTTWNDEHMLKFGRICSLLSMLTAGWHFNAVVSIFTYHTSSKLYEKKKWGTKNTLAENERKRENCLSVAENNEEAMN